MILKSPEPQVPEAAAAGGYERDPAAEAPSVSFVKPGQPVAETNRLLKRNRLLLR